MQTEITIAWIGIVGVLITNLGTLIGVMVQNKKANAEMLAKIEAERKIYQARMDEKMDVVEKKMDKHNNMIERVYKMETKQAVHETKIASLENKAEELERRLNA